MKFGVVVFPDSNCDDDMMHVLGQIKDRPTRKLLHKSTDLGNLTTDDCIILPGGFSYSQYVQAGAIARLSPLMNSVIDFTNRGGYIGAVCNAQPNVFGMVAHPEYASEDAFGNTDGFYLCASLPELTTA